MHNQMDTSTQRHVLFRNQTMRSNMPTILGSIINTYWDDLYNHLMRKDNLHFDSEEVIHMRSNNYKKNDYISQNLDLLIILHQFHTSYLTRSGSINSFTKKPVCWRPASGSAINCKLRSYYCIKSLTSDLDTTIMLAIYCCLNSSQL